MANYRAHSAHEKNGKNVHYFLLDVWIKLNLDSSKTPHDSDFLFGIIKENADLITHCLHSSFNNSIYRSELPSVFKLANITPVSKKIGRNSKENYKLHILSESNLVK